MPAAADEVTVLRGTALRSPRCWQRSALPTCATGASSHGCAHETAAVSCPDDLALSAAVSWGWRRVGDLRAPARRQRPLWRRCSTGRRRWPSSARRKATCAPSSIPTSDASNERSVHPLPPPSHALTDHGAFCGSGGGRGGRRRGVVADGAAGARLGLPRGVRYAGRAVRRAARCLRPHLRRCPARGQPRPSRSVVPTGAASSKAEICGGGVQEIAALQAEIQEKDQLLTTQAQNLVRSLTLKHLLMA